MSSYFDTVSGLPVHALVVHAAVVLVPLTALGGVLMAVRSDFSRRFGVLIVVIAAMAAASTFVAKESGEQLAARVGTPLPHADLGAVMPFVASGLFVLILVLWLMDRGIPMNRSRPGLQIAYAVLVVIGSLFAIYWTVRVGHSGAQVVWQQLLPNGSAPTT